MTNSNRCAHVQVLLCTLKTFPWEKPLELRAAETPQQSWLVTHVLASAFRPRLSQESSVLTSSLDYFTFGMTTLFRMCHF